MGAQMAPDFLRALRARRTKIAERWDTLLRLERVNSPLAHPDTLTHLIPDSLKQIFAELESGEGASLNLVTAKSERLPACSCGNNPFLAYFLAAEQALTEAAVWLQVETGRRQESDLAQIIHAVRTLARSEIETFCSVCTCRGHADKCRFASAAG